MSVSENDVRRMAQLARLDLDDSQMPDLVRDLNGILAHMQVLTSVVVPGSPEEPRTSGMPLRDDVVSPLPLAHEREEFAPAMRDGFFLVPRLSTHGDASSDKGE